MVFWVSGYDGRLRLFFSKRMFVGGSLLFLVLFYYVALPEAHPDTFSVSTINMEGTHFQKYGKGSALADDTDIVMALPEVEGPILRVMPWFGSSKEREGINSKAEKSAKIDEPYIEKTTCNVKTEEGDAEVCLSDNRKSEVEVKVVPEEESERESLQEQDDEQGDEREDGSMIEEEEEDAMAFAEAEEQVLEAVEALKEIKDDMEMNLEEDEAQDDDAQGDEGDNDVVGEDESEENEDNEAWGEEDDQETDDNMHQSVEGLFQSDREDLEDYGLSKEELLGQAGSSEAMDDEV